jgi:hypothetical protein
MSIGGGHYELESTYEVFGIVFYANIDKWVLPQKFMDAIYSEDPKEYGLPFDSGFVVVPDRIKKERKTRNGAERNINLKTKNDNQKKGPSLPQDEVLAAKKKMAEKRSDQACPLRIAFFFKKGEEDTNGYTLDGQSSLAVSTAIDICNDLGLFSANGLDDLLRLWSDGGPKHFKTLEHIYYVTTLLKSFQRVERWYFAPYFGWSICDQWFSVIKRRVEEMAADNRGVKTLDDVGKAISRSASGYALELTAGQYQSARERLPLNGTYTTTDTFVKSEFIFEVVALGKVRGKTDTTDAWKTHTISTIEDAPITDKDRDYDDNFLGKSKSYLRAITPVDDKRHRVPRRKVDEVASEELELSESESSGFDSESGSEYNE